ncbi:MAG TPA: mycothiol conjugate amidase Mca [Chloroflexota bacterium]|jgi:mycothiol S-conjugate amidase|nr:mycothiol conjugate amidase Mca [Chloroflexota bacterium]
MDLTLLAVHAHPDDEASKGSATTAKYAAEGVRTLLACCTGGEAGEVLNPRLDTPVVRQNLAELRREELRESTRILGFSRVYMLGYHDSGMAGTETNARPDNFANAPLDEAVGKLVDIIRAERPQVVLGYAEDRQFYPHPDHIRVHETTVAAFDAAGDASRYPEAGEPWQPLKLYYTGFSPRRIKTLDQAYKDRGEESPYTRWFEHGFPEEWEHSFTTYVNIADFIGKRSQALLAHRTQVDPEGFWMRLPDDVVRRVFPYEEFILAKSLVETAIPEDDLFAGIR